MVGTDIWGMRESDYSKRPSDKLLKWMSCTFSGRQIPEPWVEEPPARVPYVPRFVYDENKKEDSTQVVFLTLTSVFVIIVICCLLEVYRSHLAYKKRIERETDEDIIWSKEQATKMHESPGVKAGRLGGVTAGSGNGLPPYSYKVVSTGHDFH